MSQEDEDEGSEIENSISILAIPTFYSEILIKFNICIKLLRKYF